MALYRERGVVLRTIKLGEADRIITIATEGRGKVRVAPSASEEVTAGAGQHGEAPHRHAAIEEVPAAMHEEEGAWWQSPVVMGAIVLVLTLVLYLIFA